MQIEINPHALKRNSQKENYIWYAAYESTLFQKNLMNILKKTEDPTPPLECASIHLDQFDVILAEYQNDVRAFIKLNKVSQLLAFDI